jgi:uncharacterized protein (DUF488 family)
MVDDSMHFFTIGYGGRPPSDFISLLTETGVKTIVDVRLRPDKASMGSYAKARTSDKGIAALLAANGIGYVSLLELGNVFLGDVEWPSLYRELIDRAGDLLTRRLVGISEPYCLMCAENRVEECHRKIIAEHLTARGATVTHLE